MPKPPNIIPLDGYPVAAEDGNTALAVVKFLEGHGHHGGWSFDPDVDTIRCQCGGLAFQVDTKIGAGA